MSFRSRMQRSFFGRNGMDALNVFLVFFNLVLLTVDLFVTGYYFFWLAVILLGVVVWRALSKNIVKRQQANSRFLKVTGNLKKSFLLCRNRFRDRKTHIYKKCPACRNTLRLPRIKGDHTVCCPCCGNRFQMKVKR